MTAKRKPNGTREPFLKVIEVAERSIEKLTTLTGQQERLSDALDSTARSQMEVAAMLKDIHATLAAAPERTEMAVQGLRQHVSDESSRTRGAVLTEGASIRTKLTWTRRQRVFLKEIRAVAASTRWTRRQRIMLGLAVLGVILVAQAAGQLEPLMGAAARWLGKALGF